MPTNIWYSGPRGRCPGGYEFCDGTVDQLCAEMRKHGELAEAIVVWEHVHTCITSGTVYRCHQRISDLHPVYEGKGWSFERCPQCYTERRT